MSTPHAKRRRLNDPSSALHKPFRSPLKTASPTPRAAIPTKTPSRLSSRPSYPDDSPSASRSSSSATQAPPRNSEQQCTPREASLAKDQDATQSTQAADTAAAIEASKVVKLEIPDSESEASPIELHFPLDKEEEGEGQTRTPAATCEPPIAQNTSPLRSKPQMEAEPRVSARSVHHSPKNHGVEFGARSQQEERAKRQQIKELESQIEILRGHPAVTGSDSRRKLEGLIGTWTRVAREAAEVLFPSVRERVEGAGGVRGLMSPGKGEGMDSRRGEEDRWQDIEGEIRRREGVLERGVDGGGERIGIADVRAGREELGELRKRLEEERKRFEGKEMQGGNDHDDDNNDNDETTFTMGTMLRGMNIEWDLLGWDEKEGQWKDVGN
ncbi:Swi5-dependent recombination DNA repair protein 1 [Elsinoe australis]|uniref:Swi5-dependent recombination DNA repair protein 1 n=1 Tax=Elsinoe australis TaxID=40998 RepID=A0A2P8A046_9PEZI|nr:Swi5-dependent recombination DNA repair protein 1 [Elsinoe australis]